MIERLNLTNEEIIDLITTLENVKARMKHVRASGDSNWKLRIAEEAIEIIVAAFTQSDEELVTEMLDVAAWFEFLQDTTQQDSLGFDYSVFQRGFAMWLKAKVKRNHIKDLPLSVRFFGRMMGT